ncbi:MAG: HD domain-containing protein [Ignavibacteriales bacterium]|nr:HD domain-containing protein [Ignavibacteriales bacterium]
MYKTPCRLTSDEWKLVKLHPLIACEQILRPLGIFDEYLPIIQCHHEFIDGSGYPIGKKGDQIPLEAQIISIIDSYQAMRAEKPGRKPMDFDEALDVYIRNAGIKWDKDLITTFTAIIADPMIKEKLATGYGFRL